jgi:hypothetical protein
MGTAKTIIWAAVLSLSFASHVIAGAEGSNVEGTEWELTRTPDGNFYRLITHGQAVWGHEIGALFPVVACDEPILWVSWSSFDQRLNETAEGTVTTFAFASSGQREFRDLPLLAVWRPFETGTALLSFTNLVLDDDLREVLRSHAAMTVWISGPENLTSVVDVVEDQFDTRGFAEAERVAQESCRTSADNGPW